MKKLLGENNIQELEEQLIEISKSYNSKEKNNGQASLLKISDYYFKIA